jgi:hypothetical protein
MVPKMLVGLTIGTVWRWSTIENWRAAADLGVKLAATLGAIAASSFFFVLKPEIELTATYYLKIDRQKLKAVYSQAGSEAPSAIAQLREVVSYLPDQLPGIFAKAYTGGWWISANGVNNLPDWFGFFPAGDLKIPGEVESIFRSRFGLLGSSFDESWVSVMPAYAQTLLAYRGDLTVENLAMVLQAVEDSLYYQADVRVSNAGRAIARNVEVLPPEGWASPDDSSLVFDLPPSASRDLVYESDVSPQDFKIAQAIYAFGVQETTAGSPQFHAMWDPSEILDTTALKRIGLALFILWTAIVSKDIFVPAKRPGS